MFLDTHTPHFIIKLKDKWPFSSWLFFLLSFKKIILILKKNNSNWSVFPSKLKSLIILKISTTKTYPKTGFSIFSIPFPSFLLKPAPKCELYAIPRYPFPFALSMAPKTSTFGHYPAFIRFDGKFWLWSEIGTDSIWLL